MIELRRNDSPRGPGSIPKTPSQREIRRWNGQINRDPVRLTAHAGQHNEHMMPSVRAVKRISGSRKTVR